MFRGRPGILCHARLTVSEIKTWCVVALLMVINERLFGRYAYAVIEPKAVY